MHLKTLVKRRKDDRSTKKSQSDEAGPLAAVNGKRGDGFAMIRAGDGSGIWVPEGHVDRFLEVHGVNQVSDEAVARHEEAMAQQVLGVGSHKSAVSDWARVCEKWEALALGSTGPDNGLTRYYASVVESAAGPMTALALLSGLERLKWLFPQRPVLEDWRRLMGQPMLHSFVERLAALLARYLVEESGRMGLSLLDVLFDRGVVPCCFNECSNTPLAGGIRHSRPEW